VSRTLVTGASGFIGSHVTHLLLARGGDVSGMARSTSRLDALEGLPVNVGSGNRAWAGRIG